MKKLLLTLIVSFAFFGSVLAQSHWPAIPNKYFSRTALNAYVQIDGVFVDTEDNYADLEIAAFINGTCRAHSFMEDYTDEGDLYPMVDLYLRHDTLAANNTTIVSEADAIVSFQMYDHASGILYESCTSNITITPGDGDHIEIFLGDNDNAVILNFASPASGYTLEINPYADERDNYYLIASPVGEISASAVEGLRTPDFDFFSFAQGEQLEWINLGGDENYMLQPGVGYLYANNTGTDLVFNGTPNNAATVEVNLTYAEAAEGLDFPDWNLVGNPFEVPATLDQPFYSMVEGAFVPNGANATLPAMNGAFVVGSDEVTTVTFSRQTGNKAPLFALNLTEAGKLLDRAIVSFGQGRQLPKFQIFSGSKVYIPQNGQDYAVVTSEGMGEMPVSFKAESNGSYSLNLSSENVDFAYLHLIDNLTGADQDLLANPSYSFSANTTDYASRFRLVFATGSDEENFAFFSNGSLFINNEGNAMLQIVDVTGRIIKCESINGCANVNINAASGVYMVRLVNGDNVKVQKVVK
jgi:hypothetical protein